MKVVISQKQYSDVFLNQSFKKKIKLTEDQFKRIFLGKEIRSKELHSLLGLPSPTPSNHIPQIKAIFLKEQQEKVVDGVTYWRLDANNPWTDKKYGVEEGEYECSSLEVISKKFPMNGRGWRGYGWDRKSMTDQEKAAADCLKKIEDLALMKKYYTLGELSLRELMDSLYKLRSKYEAKGIGKQTKEFWFGEDTEEFRAVSAFLSGEYDKEMIKHAGAEIAQKQRNMHRKHPLPGPAQYMPPGFRDIAGKYATEENVIGTLHYILPAIAAIAIWFPGPGTLIAYVAEGIDIILYVYEGDYWGAAFGVIFLALPGLGMYLRRIGTPGVKKIANIFKEFYSMTKGGKSPASIEMMKHIIPKKGSEAFIYMVTNAKKTLSALEFEAFEYILKHGDDILKVSKMGKKEVETLIKQNKTIWEKYTKYYKTFSKGSQAHNEMFKLSTATKIIWGAGVGAFIYLDQSGHGKIIGETLADFINHLKSKFGFENLTIEDSEEVINKVIKAQFSPQDAEQLKLEIKSGLEAADSTEQSNLLIEAIRLVNNVGDSAIVNSLINDNNGEGIRDIERLKSINKDIETNPRLKNKNYRQLPLSSNYAWVKKFNCNKSISNIDLSGDHVHLKKDTNVPLTRTEQIEIKNYGEIIKVGEYDRTYEYSFYEGLWYAKDSKKNKDDKYGGWFLIKSCKSCYNLQQFLNHRDKKIDSKEAFDLELEMSNPIYDTKD